MLLLAKLKPDSRTVEVTLLVEETGDSGELFKAGVELIEAATWLGRVEFDQQRAKVEALYHEAKRGERD